MKLITKDIEKKMTKYPLYSQDGKGEKAKCWLKFFLCYGDFTWYVTEAEKQENGDILFYGQVLANGQKEWGYFTLNELKELRTPYGLGIERDKFWYEQTIEEIID